jgi:hypothetical protein
MCLPFLNLSVRYDALLRGWCVACVGDVDMFYIQWHCLAKGIYGINKLYLWLWVRTKRGGCTDTMTPAVTSVYQSEQMHWLSCGKCIRYILSWTPSRMLISCFGSADRRRCTFLHDSRAWIPAGKPSDPSQPAWTEEGEQVTWPGQAKETDKCSRVLWSAYWLFSLPRRSSELQYSSNTTCSHSQAYR